jgi:hypothetical protein
MYEKRGRKERGMYKKGAGELNEGRDSGLVCVGVCLACLDSKGKRQTVAGTQGESNEPCKEQRPQHKLANEIV